jgi:hypothetical protein
LTGKADSEILLNSSIVVISNSKAWQKANGKCPHENGVISKFDQKKIQAEFLEGRATNIIQDPL